MSILRENVIKRRPLPIILFSFLLFVCGWGLILSATYPYDGNWQAPLLATLASAGVIFSIRRLLQVTWGSMGLIAKWITTFILCFASIVYVDQVGHFLQFPGYQLWSLNFGTGYVIWLTVPMAFASMYLLTFGFRYVSRLRL
jgi:hypothetical protein